MEDILTALRAVAEPTRLRLVALCAEGDLTVSDLVRILGQTQPRVSRHLRLLCQAGVLNRYQEGSWVYHRLPLDGDNAALARKILDALPVNDPLLSSDRQAVRAIQAEREARAADYFRKNAARWDALRSLHVDEEEVERTLLDLLPLAPGGALLDVGTGTGRMLELFADKVRRAEGVDLSADMLNLARAKVDRLSSRNCTVRHGDMYRLPYDNDAFDVVLFHQVLHYAEDPARAVNEAARVLKAGGSLVVVDFAPHNLDQLRAEHEHRRLGFADSEVMALASKAGLICQHIEHLRGDPLTVTLWLTRKPETGVRKAPEVAAMQAQQQQQ